MAAHSRKKRSGAKPGGLEAKMERLREIFDQLPPDRQEAMKEWLHEQAHNDQRNDPPDDPGER
jgi:hypothetical protein